jgi:UDP-galactopyranose mutase
VVFFAHEKIRLYNSKTGFIDNLFEFTFGHVELRFFDMTRSCFERSLHAMKIFEGIQDTVGEILANHHL